jgi:hypothetical protein
MLHAAYNDTFYYMFLMCSGICLGLLLVLLLMMLPCTQAGGVEALSADPHALKEAMVYACAAGGLTCTRKVRGIMCTSQHIIQSMHDVRRGRQPHMHTQGGRNY